jgi:hypothetical protein
MGYFKICSKNIKTQSEMIYTDLMKPDIWREIKKE